MPTSAGRDPNTATATYRNHWPLVIVLAMLTMADILAIDLYLPAFPAVAESFAASEAQVRATLSVFVFGLAIGQLAYGPLLDRFGRRMPLLVGIALFVAGSVLAAVAPSIEMLLGARLLQAAGAAAGLVAPRAIVTDLFAEREAAAVYSVLGQIQMAAPVLAPLLGVLILQWGGWRACFWLLALLVLVAWMAAYRVVPDSLPAHQRSPLSPRAIASAYAGLLRDRVFLRYSLASACLLGGLFAYISSSPFILMSGFGLSSVQFGLTFGGIAILIIASGGLNIRLLPRFGPRRLLLAGLTLHALAALALLLAASAQAGAWLFIGLLACCLGSLGLVFGNLAALTMSHAGTHAGAASAFMGASQYAGAAVIGLMAGAFGTTATVLSATLFACALFTLLFGAAAGGRGHASFPSDSPLTSNAEE